MFREFIGSFGHLSVIVAFVAAALSAISYFKAHQASVPQVSEQWRNFARKLFYAHGAAVLLVVLSLFLIIYNHYFEYHYAWSHSSLNLQVKFMISCFWEGQEGSFLLWIFWHVLLGAVLLRTAKAWENGVMLVFAAVQAFLLSMILGTVLFGELKIGSSPFILLREALNAPVFQQNPGFVPADGNGLNPLLQNYWMVIHPPTLFLGFAATLVPFAFCMAGLMTGRIKEWVKPALPWAHFAALVLGTGIMMGAYWAYETLNFGGYWNWDPVENASFVPWLLLVAAIHTMIVFNKNGTALRTAAVLTCASFLLVLYATFLVRSGVLGEASVHSFTDLGLSGQLLVYLAAFVAFACYQLARQWKAMPVSEKEATMYSREFWIFAGATVLCLSAFQILVPTSIPAFNALLRFFGITSNMAPPADQVAFYTKFQLWFGLGIALLSGTGQFFWWQKMDAARLRQAMSVPLVFSLALTATVIVTAKIQDWKYILLLTAGVYSAVSNLFVLARLAKAQPRLLGGSLAHTGVALMLLGILFSSGYSNTVSVNTTGLLYNRAFSDEMNTENLLLWRNHPQQMKDYSLTYKGQRMESRDVPGFIDKEALLPTHDPFRAIAKDDVVLKGTTYAQKGDTLHIYNENVYYEIEYRRNDGKVFTLFPRIQFNEKMGQPVASPDIKSYWHADLYTHITNVPDPAEDTKWSDIERHTLAVGDTFIVNDFVAVLDGVSREASVAGIPLTEGRDFAVRANIRVLDRFQDRDIRPLYIIKDRSVGFIPEISPDLGLKVQFEAIDPATGNFTFAVATTQKDWVILKAIEKPFIALLWGGTLLLIAGFAVAVYRRASPGKPSKPSTKKQEESKKLATI